MSGTLLICAAALATSACFQMSTTMAVNGDGSGTIDHTLIMTKAALQQMRSFGALGGGRGQNVDLTSEDQAKTLASSFGPGVTYVSSTPVDTPIGQGRRSQYAFTDVSQVRLSLQPETGVSVRTSSMNSNRGQITCSMTHEADGRAILHINVPEIKLPAGGNGDAIDQQLAFIRPLLAGARIAIGVAPAGTLVKTNSPYVDGNHVTLLEANVDEVLGNQAFLQQLQAAKTPDEAREALKNVPGLKIALDREVTIEFTPAR